MALLKGENSNKHTLGLFPLSQKAEESQSEQKVTKSPRHVNLFKPLFLLDPPWEQGIEWCSQSSLSASSAT